MAQFPAMMLWTDAYLADTTHLSTIEHGAYLLLLMAMWRTKTNTLPNDPTVLARYAKLTSGQWQRVWPSIEAFFTVDGNSIAQGRLTREAEAVRQRSKSQSDNAKAKWRKENETPNAIASNWQSQPDAIHNHNHIHKEKDKKKAGSDDPDFVAFYEAYPLKKARDGALRAYRAARNRGATHEQIMAGCARYAAEKRDADPKYIKHPATWLNGGCWADESGPQPAATPLIGDPHERRMASRLKYWRETGKWSQEWGPEPGKPGCQIPAWMMEKAA